MTGLVTIGVGIAMAVGIVGTVLPFLPGTGLILTAAVAYGFLVGWSTAGFAAIATIAVLFLIGMVAKYVLADRSAGRGGAPRRSLGIGAIGAVIGFFVIPVLGVVVGGVGALVYAEYQRTGTWELAWRSTRTTLLSIGTGVVVEAFAGIAMALTWGAWVIAR